LARIDSVIEQMVRSVIAKSQFSVSDDKEADTDADESSFTLPTPPEANAVAQQQAPEQPKEAQLDIPQPEDVRPDKSKTAEDFEKDNNGLLGHLGDQENVKEDLKKKYGDWTDPTRSADDRANSAYNASRHLNAVKNLKDRDGDVRSTDVTQNGKIEGFTKSKEARHGSEAGVLKDSLKEGGMSVFESGRLPQTGDSHVRKDGTNMNNMEWVGHKIVSGLSKMCAWISKMIDKLPGPLKNLLGPMGKIIKGAADITGKAFDVADAKIQHGDVRGAARAFGGSLLHNSANAARETGQAAGKVVPGAGAAFDAVGGGLDVAGTAVETNGDKDAIAAQAREQFDPLKLLGSLA
jgi:hypothetical protein